jgi:hypothetical protein
VQQEAKNRSKDEFNQIDEETNAIDNFLYALKVPETKRQYPAAPAAASRTPGLAQITPALLS